MGGEAQNLQHSLEEKNTRLTSYGVLGVCFEGAPCFVAKRNQKVSHQFGGPPPKKDTERTSCATL